MKKQILNILLILCMLLSLVPTAFADETSSIPTTLCEINLSNLVDGTDTTEYKVETTRILLKNRSVFYVFSGTTEKDISFSNNPNDYESKTFYLRLNNANISGKIAQGNYKDYHYVIDVADDTQNTIESIILPYMEFTGKGTLTADDISTAYKDGSSISITDAAMNISPKTNSVNWDGTIELSGSARVTINGNGNYAPLKLGESFDSVLTLKDSAKFYTLQDNMDEEVPFSVDGITSFKSASIVLKDNSYLETQGKASAPSLSTDYWGCGMLVTGDLTVQDNAVLKSVAYGPAISVYNKIDILGGKVIAESKGSDGICNFYDIMNIKNADITTKSVGIGLYSSKNINIENSLVKTSGNYGIRSRESLAVNNSWVEMAKDDSHPNTIENSTIFSGNNGKVYGNHHLPFDATVASDMSLIIPEDTTLTVSTGKTFTNNGYITLNGKFVNNGGTVVCTNHTGGSANCVYPAKCAICEASYGEINSKNHSNLEHIIAKAPTVAEFGNIEYWHCKDCDKYFSDEKCENKITQDDTVIEKLITISPTITLTAPVKNAAPQTSIETEEYTASVEWSPEIPTGGTFAKSTEYTATITITTKQNYTVDGIAENGYILDGSTTVENAANSNIVKAVFPKTAGSSGGSGGTTRYTISFETNGGSEMSSQRVTRNAVAKEPSAPTKDGFDFDGWYTDKELKTKYDFSSKVTKSITLYAKWTEKDNSENQIILTIGKKSAQVFGQIKTNDVAPKIVNDRTMLPARFVAECLGAKVEWNGDKELVTITGKNLKTSEDITILITIGAENATVNGKDIKLDSPAFIENDRTYTPIRFISEELGASVEWIENEQKVVITKTLSTEKEN